MNNGTPAPAYVDEIAVERATKGDRRVTLNRLEMAAAFRYLDDRGYSASQIAVALCVSRRTVVRWRSGRNFPLSRRTSGPLAERRGLAVGRAS